VHELAVARAIAAAAERHAGGLRVTVVRVSVGRLRQVVPEYLGFYFEVAARETPCEGAELRCERVPALLRCSGCGAEWDPAPPPARAEDQLVVSFRCPDCENGDYRVVSGDELVVESIDVEDPLRVSSGAAATAAEPAGG
jgi:hydrogenase nickel incorporation protein HypA/HybF